MGDKEAAWVCEALGDFLGFESGKMQPVPRGETGAGRADAFQAIMDASRGQGLFMPVHSGCVYGNKQDQARGFMVKPPQDRWAKDMAAPQPWFGQSLVIIIMGSFSLLQKYRS